MSGLIAELPLGALFAFFGVAGVVIAIVGTWLVAVVDRVADATGLGEAMAGALLLGVTSASTRGRKWCCRRAVQTSGAMLSSVRSGKSSGVTP